MIEALNMAVVKETYIDELVRENARLAVQHEVDRQRIELLSERAAQADQLEAELTEAQSQILDLQAGANAGKNLADKLLRAVSDLHFVMAGGDPCKVCGKVCMMGTTKCEPCGRARKRRVDYELEAGGG